MTKRFQQFRFLEWEVYRDAQKLFFKVRNVATKLPREYRFEIGSQIIRSSLSVVLNIAEGSGKSSRKEMGRFIEIALGSLYETRAALDTLEKDDTIPVDLPDEIVSDTASIGRQLGGLKRALLRKDASDSSTKTP